jgi:preprotein translocase subunit SecG
VTEFIETPLTVIHIICCLFLTLVVLLQPGKSGGLGAITGAAAQQVFGGRGAGNFLSKTTWVCATVFFLSSATLAYLSTSTDSSLKAKSVQYDTQGRGHLPQISKTPAKTPAPAPSK